IPVVLLSGQSEIANRLEGLSRGADGFLAKPFIIEELNVMIKNLLKKNTILKSKFSGNQEFLEQNVKDVQVSNPDKEIVEKVIKNINENLADPDFNVTALAENVGISRVQLHRKLKDFAGINASNLIRNIRLEQAGRMLSETSNTISEIAYAVGFNNVGHFSKVFKQHFGISPKDYAKMQSETDGNENDNEEDM
ncbi:MAG: DNA-binding response regulator, partial [Bacteroidales bacterium]|nr:DNA-binding response regulator [Bacteroidales bacterium]